MRMRFNSNRSAQKTAAASQGFTKIADAMPPEKQVVTLFCMDHRGIYQLPFKCAYDGHSWVNKETNEDVMAEAFGWVIPLVY
jgi:hypothetical protein